MYILYIVYIRFGGKGWGLFHIACYYWWILQDKNLCSSEPQKKNERANKVFIERG